MMLNRNPTAATVLFAALLSMLDGCASNRATIAPDVPGERSLVESSAERLPEWVVREPESDREYHYFRGFRSDAPSLEGGETDARHNAMSHIVQFLGLRVEVDYERMRTEDQTRIQDAIRSVGGADIFGTRLSELYYRRWRVHDGDRIDDRYDVYVLIRFPREAIERIRHNQDERLRAIQETMAGPGIMARPEEFYGQISGAARALAAVEGLNASVLITTETEGRAQQLRQQAEVRLTRLVGALRLRVETSAVDVPSGSLDEPFTAGVTVSTERNGATSRVPNVPVAISFGDSTRVVWSDAQGVAGWSTQRIPVGEGEHELVARVELPADARAMPDLQRSLPTAAARINVVPVTAMTTLLVLLDERSQVSEAADMPRFSEARLVEALKLRGFRVISLPTDTTYDLAADPWTSEGVALALAERSGATLLVRGSITTDTPTPVAMMPGVFFTRVELRLSLISVRDGQVVGSVVLPDHTLRDTRGFGNSPERAAADALELDRNRQPNGYTHVASRIAEILMR